MTRDGGTRPRTLGRAALLAALALAAPTVAAGDAVCLHYLGHAAFVLELADGTRVLTDYGASRAWGLDSPVHSLGGLVPDVVTISHAHEDHAGGALPDGIGHVLRGPGELTLGDLKVRSIPAFERGLEKPDNRSFLFTFRGIRILHLGDVQALVQASDTEEGRRRIRELYPERYDVVLVPIGFVKDILEPAATFVSLLRARTIVPMHYWNPEDRDAFLKLVSGRLGADGKPMTALAAGSPRFCPGATADAGTQVVGLEPRPWAPTRDPIRPSP